MEIICVRCASVERRRSGSYPKGYCYSGFLRVESRIGGVHLLRVMSAEFIVNYARFY